MKKSNFNSKNMSAIALGMIMGLLVMVGGAQAQGPHAEEWKGKLEQKDELIIETMDLELPQELPSVTFLNKAGEVVAVLHGDKSVLEETYTARFSRSYFLTASGIHEYYMIK